MTNPTPSGSYERTDWHFKVVVIFLTILSIGALGSVILTYGIHRAFLKYDRPKDAPVSPLVDFHRIPPEPRLQIDDAADLVKFHETENSILNSYGWNDPAASRVRIPIDRAIELTAERGLPARKGESR
jgi:hypothetical protein